LCFLGGNLVSEKSPAQSIRNPALIDQFATADLKSLKEKNPYSSSVAAISLEKILIQVILLRLMKTEFLQVRCRLQSPSLPFPPDEVHSTNLFFHNISGIAALQKLLV
jgi:hypothetical protein